MLTGVSPLQHPKNQIILVGPTGPRMSNQSSSNYYCSEVRLPECSLVTIVAIGGGGGGAAGGTSTGGSGGGSGAMTTLTMPRVLLPHLIYCFVSIGGIGGVYNSTNPTQTFDLIDQNIDTIINYQTIIINSDMSDKTESCSNASCEPSVKKYKRSIIPKG